MTSKNANLPRWREGQKTKAGTKKAGFWYIWNNGKQCSLSKYGSPRVKGGKPEFNQALEARQKFIDAMKKQEAQQRVVATASQNWTVADVCNYWIAEVLDSSLPKEERKSADYIAAGTRCCVNFCTGKDGGKNGIEAYNGWGKVEAGSLTHDHIKSWIGKHSWSTAGKRAAVMPIKSAFSYAFKNGKIKSNPLAKFKLKHGAPREDVEFSAEEQAKVEAVAKGGFRIFFRANIEMGTRPSELARVTPAHVVIANGSMTFRLPWHSWKNGKKGGHKPRMIAVPEAWHEWVKNRMEEVEENQPLFVNQIGTKWVARVWGKNFQTIREQTGINPKLSMYSARHTFITRALRANVPIAAIACQCGTSVKEIERVYNQLGYDATIRQDVVDAVASFTAVA